MLTNRWEIMCDQTGCFNKLTSRFKSDLKSKAKGLGWSFVGSLVGSLLGFTTHTCPACQLKARSAPTDPLPEYGGR